MEEPQNETENVRVFIRIRPLVQKNAACVEESVDTISLIKSDDVAKKSFTFDHIFNGNATQLDVYHKVALPIVDQVFKGYNGTIFAYGQTGSGKTYTMMGSNAHKGITPNTFSHIFTQISRESGERSFVVTATYLEIYNEEVRDLLSPNVSKKLELRERIGLGVYVKGLTGFTVDSATSAHELMRLGNCNRATRATAMNATSSRSHAIFTITLEAKDSQNNTTTSAKLNLVDLAGSERLKRTQATGDGLKEAGNINQSLFVLSNVISALVESNTRHIPYRNSKLTRLLQDSLGGNSKTALIATVSPLIDDYDESLCTLRYASRTKLVQNCARPNLQTDNSLIDSFQQEIKELQKRLEVINRQRREDLDNKLSVVERSKQELQQKIDALQNKILTGGQNLLKQQFLIELEVLGQSHEQLQGILGEKENERFELEDRYESLQEEDADLDMKIARLESILEDTTRQRDEDVQAHNDEIRELSNNYDLLCKELTFSKLLVKSSVPRHLIKQLNASVVWNNEICDYEVASVAHAGNNMKKRRFKKHVPKEAVFNQRLNVMRIDKRSSPKTVYNTYDQRKNNTTTD